MLALLWAWMSLSLSLAAPAICDEIQLSTQHMPENIENNRLGWCFAHAATEVLSDHLKVKLSVHDIATNYYQSFLWDSDRKKSRITKHPTGGYVISALMAMEKRKICREDEADFFRSDWLKQSEEIREYASECTKKCKIPDNEITEEVCNDPCRAGQGPLQLFCDLFGHMTSEDRLGALFDTTCRKTGVYIDYDTQLQEKIEFFGKSMLHGDAPYVNKPEETRKEIQKALFRDKKPVAVGFDTNMLLTEVSGKHAATVIGQRFREGKCEWIIRNNWGPRCDFKNLPKGVSCDNGIYYVEREWAASKIESGLWIP